MRLDSELSDLMAACMTSTKTLAQLLMPERFSSPFSSYIHDQIFDLIDSDEPRVAIAAPRGAGKTSICLAKATQAILFRQKHFIPWISVSHDGASLQTENLKRELTSSREIKQIFGGVKTKNATEMDETFSKKSWVAFGHTLVMPRGCGQQIRGVLFGSSRPDLFIIDDLEDPNDVKSDELRKARKEWFWADLVKAVSRFDKGWRLIYIDTLKHEDSLLQDLLDSPDWASVRLEICNDKIETLAPEIMSQAELDRDYKSHKRSGNLDIFYREYRNLPTSTEDASFMQSYFRYKDEQEISQLDSHIENVVLVDPAKTVKMHSAESAIVGVGIDTKSNALYVRDIDSGMFYPDDLYQRTINMIQRLKARVLGVEVTSLNEFITQPFKNELSRQGILWCEFIELKARGGINAASKEQRIRALVPYYRQGLIFHNPSACTGLEAQLLAFPRSKRWDIMDALAYVIEMLDVGDRFFEPPEDLDDEEMFLDLEKNDEAVMTGWRSI